MNPAQGLAPPQVSVLICTFHRTGLLFGLLEALLEQVNAPTFETVVIDNDQAGSAAVVAQNPRWRPLRIRYEIERRRGISNARNHGVELAVGQWIAMIDDDERPDPDWLAQLMRSQQAHQADVVFGPIIPYISADAPQWLFRGRFLERNRHPTGTPVPNSELRCGNLLMKRSLLDTGVRFDVRFSITGGEDVMFFRSLRSPNTRYIWCDEAIVREFQPEPRYQVEWVLKRAFNGGQNFAEQERSIELHGPVGRYWATSRMTIKAIAQLLVATPLFLLLSPLWLLPGQRHIAVSALCKVYSQLGKLSAFTPHRAKTYGGAPEVLSVRGKRISDVPEDPDLRDRRRSPRWPTDSETDRRAKDRGKNAPTARETDDHNPR